MKRLYCMALLAWGCDDDPTTDVRPATDTRPAADGAAPDADVADAAAPRCADGCARLAACAATEAFCSAIEAPDEAELARLCTETCDATGVAANLTAEDCPALVAAARAAIPQFERVCDAAPLDCPAGCARLAECTVGDRLCPGLGPAEAEELVRGCGEACAEAPALLEALRGLSCEDVVEGVLAVVPQFVELCEAPLDCATGCTSLADCAAGDEFCPRVGPAERAPLIEACTEQCGEVAELLDALQRRDCTSLVANVSAAVPDFNAFCNDLFVERPACAEGPLLTQAPLALEDVAVLAPIATLVPPDHTFPTPHMYFSVFDNDPATADLDTAPMVAPGDLWVTDIAVRAYDSFNGVPDVRDFDLDFYVCRDVEGYFIHVRTLDHPELRAQAEAGIAEGRCDLSGPGTSREGVVNERACSMRLGTPVRLRAGEVIGTTGNRPVGITGLDMGMRDYRMPHGRDFANPDRWCRADERSSRSRCYAVSPFDLMDPAVAAPYLARMGDGFGTPRLEAPLAGNGVYLDVPGTAQGYWFPDPDPGRLEAGPEALHLYLGPNDIRPSLLSFSLGQGLEAAMPPVRAAVFTFAPRAEGLLNRAFADLTPGTVYCYERLSGGPRDLDAGQDFALGDAVLLLQLEGDQLHLESRAGRECGAEPYALTPAAIHFRR